LQQDTLPLEQSPVKRIFAAQLDAAGVTLSRSVYHQDHAGAEVVVRRFDDLMG